MLQQILRDMFIDPELLAELDEEQKQVLFCKMREEQIRRWKERDDKLEKEEKKNQSKKPKKPGGKNKQVNWLMAKDGKPWVWVMGEHERDKTIEQIMEEEAQASARAQAEKEAAELCKKAEEEETRKLKEEEDRLRTEAEKKAEELRIAAQKAEELRLQAEKESQAREEAKRLEEQQRQKLEQIKRRHELQRRQSIDQVEEIKNRRSMEIYSSFKETRKLIEQEAEESCKIIEEEWQEQEKKSKAAEQERREIARRAREEHRRSLKESFKTNAQAVGKAAASLSNMRKPAIPEKPGSGKVRPPKPADRQAIVDWFKEVERPKGAGYDTKTKKIAPWFHGVISRQDAEDLLQDKLPGTFLIRVSERIWGYAISYRGPAKCKHFLIDTSDGTYQFFGTNQISHNKLADLVHFHKARPISTAGQEKLLYPCTQQSNPPNYADLFPSENSQVL